jgi:hypothetical protein
MTMASKSKYSSTSFIRKVTAADLNVTAQNAFVNIENILKSNIPLDEAADRILDTVLMDNDIITKKDVLDRFLDYIHFKAKTGHDHIINLAYPTKRIDDPYLEGRIIELVNIHLVPGIIFPLLKYFTRNVQNSDINLYVAQILQHDDVIKPLYETFLMFKKDVFNQNKTARTKNVKRLQQHTASVDDRTSSPLDAACRLKYILEYIAIKQNVSHLYTKENLLLFPI